jgi:hypothetical protein
MHRLIVCAALLVPAAANAAVIGETSTAKNEVTGQLASILRDLRAGDPVSADELVSTGSASATVLRFLDNSTLNIGASSSVTLDRFVFNPDRTAQNVVINLARGAMRFATGNSDARNFTLRTPVATLGIRGTRVILICDGSDRCVFVLDKGKALVCPHPLPTSQEPCPDGYEIDEVSNFTFVGPDGTNSGPQKVSRSVVDAANNAIAEGRFINLADIGKNLPKFGENVPGPGFNPFVLGAIPVTFAIVLGVNSLDEGESD